MVHKAPGQVARRYSTLSSNKRAKPPMTGSSEIVLTYVEWMEIDQTLYEFWSFERPDPEEGKEHDIDDAWYFYWYNQDEFGTWQDGWDQFDEAEAYADNFDAQRISDSYREYGSASISEPEPTWSDELDMFLGDAEESDESGEFTLTPAQMEHRKRKQLVSRRRVAARRVKKQRFELFRQLDVLNSSFEDNPSWMERSRQLPERDRSMRYLLWYDWDNNLPQKEPRHVRRYGAAAVDLQDSQPEFTKTDNILGLKELSRWRNPMATLENLLEFQSVLDELFGA